MASLAVLTPSPLFRAGLAALLSTMGFEPVDQAADLEELKRRATDVQRPEILLVSLPQTQKEISGLLEKTKNWAPQAKVVFLASGLDVRTMVSCFAAGAVGYLLENISRDALRHNLGLVGIGENVFPSELARALSSSAPHDISTAMNDDFLKLGLTDRDVEILRNIAAGRSNRFIGTQLGISEGELRITIKRILNALRLSNRTQAALWGVARGLAPPFSALTKVAEMGRQEPKQNLPREDAVSQDAERGPARSP